MIHLICALKCEANPLIEHWKLRQVEQADAYTCYINQEGDLSLTITRPGKINMAAGTAYTHGFFNTRKSDAWLNVGIAGHRSIITGEAVLAHQIQDDANNNVYYPQIIFDSPCLTSGLRTLDKSSTEYEEVMFDMEASAYYAVACRFATSELIHTLKVISDNAIKPAERFDAKSIEQLITGKINIIEQLINQLCLLSAELEIIQKPSPHFEGCIARWRFTQYERHTLSRLLNRWATINPGQDPLQTFASITHGKEFLKQIKQSLDTQSVYLHKTRS